MHCPYRRLMMNLRTPLCMLLVASAVLGCSKKTPEAGLVGAARENPNVAALAEATSSDQAGRIVDGKLDPNDPKHGARRLMGLDVGVFVDGVQASVLYF